MSGMPMGGYIEGKSPVHRMDAFVKLLCTFLLLAAVILCDTAAGAVLILAGISVIIRVSSIRPENAWNGVRHLRMFFLFIFLMNAFFSEAEQLLWSWWIFRLSTDGMRQGIQVVLRVALAMVLGNILVSVTSPLEITGAIETLIFPLQYAGVPIQEVALILGVAIQFIPTFAEEADMIRKAQTARGARFESRKLTERAQSVMPLVIPVFLSAFRRADELSIAMEARGYHRRKGKIRFRKRKAGGIEMAAILFSCLLCAAEIFI